MIVRAMLIGACAAISVPVAAQDRASSYSMGTYNPVQAQIWRDQINGAIIRQSTGHYAHASRTHRTGQRHRRR